MNLDKIQKKVDKFLKETTVDEIYNMLPQHVKTNNMTQTMHTLVVKRGDNLFCQGVERMIPAHPDHLKFFEDNIGNIVEIELKEVDEQHRSTTGEWLRSYSTYTYAVPKVDEWEDICKAMVMSLGVNKSQAQPLVDYLKQHFTITRK